MVVSREGGSAPVTSVTALPSLNSLLTPRALWAFRPPPRLRLMTDSEVTTESLSRAQRRQQRNRQALVDAARHLFAGRGYEATTIADIAQAADLGFGTFYLYFHGKEAILEAVLEDGISQVAEALQEADPPNVAPADALVSVSERFIRLIRSHRDLLTLTGQPARDGHGRRSRPLAELLTRTFQRVIERGMADGSFTVGDARIAARAITGMHIQLLVTAERDSNERALIETIPSLALGGLRHAESARRYEQ